MAMQDRRFWLKIPDDTTLHYFGFLRLIEDKSEYLTDQEVADKLGEASAVEKLEDKVAAELRKLFLDKATTNSSALEWLLQWERGRGNLLAAEGILSRLLFVNPASQLHAKQRQELSTTVDVADNATLAKIDELNKQCQQLMHSTKFDAKKAALLKARKAQFFHRYLFHTLAIEGSALRLEQIVEYLENDERELATKEDSVGREDYLELLGMNEVLLMVDRTGFDNAKDLATKLTLDFIKAVHKLMFERIEAEELNFVDAGQFRYEPVFLRWQPVEGEFVESEMDKFVGFLKDGIGMVENGQMHPVEFAALGHYYFVHIHPMNDGNGRIGRLILHLILKCFNLPPIIIQHTTKEEYLDALLASNAGDLRPFLRIIAGFVLQTMEVTLLQGLPYPIVEGDSGCIGDYKVIK